MSLQILLIFENVPFIQEMWQICQKIQYLCLLSAMLTRDYVELWRKRKPHLQQSLQWELATEKYKNKITQIQSIGIPQIHCNEKQKYVMIELWLICKTRFQQWKGKANSIFCLSLKTLLLMQRSYFHIYIYVHIRPVHNNLFLKFPKCQAVLCYILID